MPCYLLTFFGNCLSGAWNGKAIYLCDLIPKPAGHSGNIRTGCGSCQNLIFQKVDLGFPDLRLIASVQVMIGSVMMDRITPQIPKVVYIPCKIIHI